MGTIWTPSGEHQPEPEGDARASDRDFDDFDGELTEEELAEELRRARAEIAATPAADIVANHAVGLWQLAVLHLTPDSGEPKLAEASLAIDAMAAVVEGLGDRLGEHATTLSDALTQLRLAFVQVQDRARADQPPAD